MSYKALLFCPEDKTARVVTQVLSELEFQVERCNEPFAAVKKLMAEHFDAIVVDNDNEQNATLLFKSARNSGANQASLSVAVVEGQAGVAKAFRIGANLVLTKPINVEQSKGTLRVARGLLRKTDFTKAAFTPPAVTRPVVAGVNLQLPPTPEISAPRPAMTSLPAQPPPSVIPMAGASVLEVEKEPEPQPEPAEAALLESMPDPVGPRNLGASPGSVAGSKHYPWQPISKPVAESAAAAIRPSAETAGAEVDSLAASAMSASTASTAGTRSGRSQSGGSQSLVSAQGAAAAPAPAKDAPHSVVRTPAEQVEPPLFSSFGGVEEEHSSGSRGARKILIAAVLLLAAAGAGYVGWSRIHPPSSTLAQKLSTPVPTAPVQAPAPASPEAAPAANSELNGSSANAESQPVEQAPDITLTTADSATPTADSGPSTPPPAKVAKPGPGVKTKQPAIGKNPPVSKAASSLAAPAHAANPNSDANTKEVVVVKNEYFTPVPQTAPPRTSGTAGSWVSGRCFEYGRPSDLRNRKRCPDKCAPAGSAHAQGVPGHLARTARQEGAAGLSP